MNKADDIVKQLAHIYRIDEGDVWGEILYATSYEKIKDKSAYSPDSINYIKRKIYYSMVTYNPMDFDRIPINEDGVEELIVRLLDAVNEEIISKIPDTGGVQSAEDGFNKLAQLTNQSRDAIAGIFESELLKKIETNTDLNNVAQYRNAIFNLLPLHPSLQDNESTQRYYDAVLRKTFAYLIDEKVHDFQTRGILTPPEPRNTVQTLNVTYDFGKNKSE